MAIDINKAKFIALEGLEGAGKSTAMTVIKDYLQQSAIDAIYTREPGGTVIAEQIRRILVSDCPQEALSAESEMLLMYASRLQHINHLIKPSLMQGSWVVSDRFNWSSLAYQGGGRQLGLAYVKQLNDMLLDGFKADLIIYLDVDPVLGLERARSRNTLDRIEQEELSFFTRARSVFLDLVETHENSVCIDASQPLEDVATNIAQALSYFINESA